MIRAIIRLLDFLSPLADLALRCWVAWVFFKSGLSKYQTFDTYAKTPGPGTDRVSQLPAPAQQA